VPRPSPGQWHTGTGTVTVTGSAAAVAAVIRPNGFAAAAAAAPRRGARQPNKGEQGLILQGAGSIWRGVRALPCDRDRSSEPQRAVSYLFYVPPDGLRLPEIHRPAGGPAPARGPQRPPAVDDDRASDSDNY
jgi:hypothetical protein